MLLADCGRMTGLRRKQMPRTVASVCPPDLANVWREMPLLSSTHQERKNVPDSRVRAAGLGVTACAEARGTSAKKSRQSIPVHPGAWPATRARYERLSF